MRQTLNLRPGDSVDIIFPEGFTVEYTKTEKLSNGSWGPVIHSSICTRMNAYYWDEDDHYCVDYYFYNDNIDRRHFAKDYNLTQESFKKVSDFVKQNYKNNK